MGAVPAVQEHVDAQRRQLTQAWDVRAIFLKDPASVPKLYRVRAGGQEGKGGKEPDGGHLLWPLPSAVVTGGNTASLSSVRVNVGQGRRTLRPPHGLCRHPPSPAHPLLFYSCSISHAAPFPSRFSAPI